jgi:hypothetical protein
MATSALNSNIPHESVAKFSTSTGSPEIQPRDFVPVESQNHLNVSALFSQKVHEQ